MHIPNEVITALIGLVSVGASSVISFIISKKAAETEIKKLKLSWEHDETQKKDRDFEKMVADVSKILVYPHISVIQDALDSVSVVRAQSTGPEAEAIDNLYIALTSQDKPDIQDALDRAIEQKRQRTR